MVAQETNFIKVHFLYGSKPLPEYKSSELKSFGGVLGGHVGIEGESDRIINFIPTDSKLHIISKKDNMHSSYTVHSVNDFYAILGGHPDSVKKAVVVIPVTGLQKQRFDSIAAVYLKQTPYDYAFLGMRCGAATYEILAQLEILPQLSLKKTSKRIFYPKLLRQKLLAKAEINNWTIERQEGSPKRKWEQD